MSSTLDPLQVPLFGTRLIEASAGTGKTWTIATLVLRLILGMGTPQQAPIPIQRILVLTFTRAATRELVERIRHRLAQAHEVFSQADPLASDDAVLRGLWLQFNTADERRMAIWRLEQAVAGVDEAAITTIDAWVQRLLTEIILPVGEQPPQHLLEDDEPWIQACTRDYWRQQVYPLNDPAMQALITAFMRPEDLAPVIRDALRAAPENRLKPQSPGASLQSLLDQWTTDRQARLAQTRMGWTARVPQMQAWLLERVAGPVRKLSKTAIPDASTVLQWCEAIHRWAQGLTDDIPGINAGPAQRRQLRQRLTPEGLRKAHLKAFQAEAVADLPLWSSHFEDLVAALDALPKLQDTVVEHALAWVADRVHRLKQEHSTWTFDDLLAQVNTALLTHPEFAKHIRQQHPVGLVDEFQDTSPGQFQLFDRIYDIAGNRSDIGLLLIGDPKQSIYRFRGADIHSYLQARRLVQDRLHTLDTNHRSVRPLVDEVNRWFAHGESLMAARGEGAFRHAQEVPFQPVQAADRAERLVRRDAPMPVLSVWTRESAMGPRQARLWDAQQAAQRLAALLNDPEIGFQAPGQPRRRLRAGDCCVLVRSRGEAAAVRKALIQHRVPSAFLSERESVLNTPEAEDLRVWLHALSQPQDLKLARRLWATSLMDLSAEVLQAQRDDASLWDARIRRLMVWSQMWRELGVLAAIRAIIQQEGVAARAQQDPQRGARRLTNALHLAEWLQELSTPSVPPLALLRQFEDALAAPDAQGLPGQARPSPGGRDTLLMRLESDSDRVQVVTIHKSKGLQYPVVLMPFATSVNRAEDETEALREEIRLLYVALTRAVHQVWLGATPRLNREGGSSVWDRSGLGALVSAGPRDGPGAVADLRQLLGASPAAPSATDRPFLEVLGDDTTALPAFLEPTQHPNHTPLPEPEVTPQPVAMVARPIDTAWRLSSYSRLVLGAGDSASRSAFNPDWSQIRWDEQAMVSDDEPHTPSDDQATADPAAPVPPWHQLPSSAAFGQLLHSLLELAAEHRFQWPPDLDEIWAQAIRHSAWAHETQTLRTWLTAIITQPLPVWGVPLAGLDNTRAELEFWMPLQHLDLERLDAWLHRHVLPGQARPRLKPQILEGLIMGFADLVIGHGGRYGILDYKSNRLGSGPQDYAPRALERALLEHRYDAQAALYQLAVMRMLGRRTGSLQHAAAQMGPAQFFFIRGVDHPQSGVLSLDFEAPALLALDGLLAGTLQAQTP